MRDRRDGSYIFSDASIIDSEYVLQALGVRDGLNLEGRGTSATSIGGVDRAPTRGRARTRPLRA